MKILLRLITVWLGLFVLVPMLFLAWHFVGMRSLAPSSWRSIAGMIAMVAVLVAFIGFGILGMHRLWHFRETGRRITAALLGLLVALFLAIAVRSQSTRGVAAPLVLNAVAVGVLLSPSAKRVCA